MLSSDIKDIRSAISSSSLNSFYLLVTTLEMARLILLARLPPILVTDLPLLKKLLSPLKSDLPRGGPSRP